MIPSRLFLAVILGACLAAAGLAADVVIVEGQKAQKVKVGDTVRVIGVIPSGQGDIDAKVDGPGTLTTNTVRRVKNGQPLIGTLEKEFNVKADKKGTLKITVTVDNKVQKKTDKHEYTIDVEE